ncbi:hypothetical protein [Pseudomonas sp. TNT3]|nr:hypothetical protein [Pseudomonas sp. TNT3]KAI2679938.1 hypothetical protein GBC55_017985 [Pseudomonas sp. TNT3]
MSDLLDIQGFFPSILWERIHEKSGGPNFGQKKSQAADGRLGLKNA